MTRPPYEPPAVMQGLVRMLERLEAELAASTRSQPVRNEPEQQYEAEQQRDYEYGI